MLTADAKRLIDSLPRKTRIPLNEIWKALEAAFPGRQGENLRGFLTVLLDELVEKKQVELPKGKWKYDYGGQYKLPLFVKRQGMKKEVERLDFHIWAPELLFLSGKTLPSNTPWLAIDAWLKTKGTNVAPCPVRERSLEIFGDDKTLGEWLPSTKPFNTSQITFGTLFCYNVPMPLATSRPQSEAPPRALVVENLATYDSISHANAIRKCYRVIVFGNGNAFSTGWEDLLRIKEDYGVSRCLYFGDLDGLGVSIPYRVSKAAPHAFFDLATDLYMSLISKQGENWQEDGSRLDVGAEEWIRVKLPEAPDVVDLIVEGKRLPQEWLNRQWFESNL